jgi:hypothetical protein
MRRCSTGFVLLLSLGHAGCSLPEGKRGAACERSTQCQDGLVCIERRCTTNLAPVARQSVVPELATAAGDEDGG